MEEGRKRFPRYSSFRDKSKFSASPSLPAAVALVRYQHSARHLLLGQPPPLLRTRGNLKISSKLSRLNLIKSMEN